jgi:hypothetical protein
MGGREGAFRSWCGGQLSLSFCLSLSFPIVASARTINTNAQHSSQHHPTRDDNNNNKKKNNNNNNIPPSNIPTLTPPSPPPKNTRTNNNNTKQLRRQRKAVEAMQAKAQADLDVTQVRFTAWDLVWCTILLPSFLPCVWIMHWIWVVCMGMIGGCGGGPSRPRCHAGLFHHMGFCVVLRVLG